MPNPSNPSPSSPQHAGPGVAAEWRQHLATMQGQTPDQQRMAQIRSQRHRLDAETAAALLYTSARDGLHGSARLLLTELAVPPAAVGWSPDQASRYLGGEYAMARSMVAPEQVVRAMQNAKPRKTVHWADAAPSAAPARAPSPSGGATL